MDFMHSGCAVSDRGRHLDRRTASLHRNPKGCVILQRGGNQKTQSGELQKAERIDLKEALFCQHHVKQTFFEKCKGKRSGEPLLTGVIPIQLQSSRRTPETSYIPN